MSHQSAAPAKSAGPSVALSDLSFSWPNGRQVLSHLNASFAPGRTGLIGVNGAGKSTLLRLIAGQLRPSSGSVTVTGEVGYLPQNLALDTGTRAAELLGIAGVLDAIGSIEAGDTSQAAFDAVGNDWDAADRAGEWLSRLGLAHVGLADPVGLLSGGETIMTALTGQFLRRPAVMLLDEPTNNLDLAARRRLYATVESWPGVMLIVSHDRELLALMDQIADLRSDHYGDSLRMYGGNLADYQAMLEVEQAAARRAVVTAEADVRRRRRVETESQTKQAGRDRQGRKLAASGSIPRIVAGARKRAAQESAGRSRDIHAERVANAQARLAEAEEAVRDDDAIRISLPGTAVPAGRTVLTVRGLDGPWLPWRPAEAVHDDGAGEGEGEEEREKERGRGRNRGRGGRAGRAHRPGAGTDRADRAERGGQDHPAPDHRRATPPARPRPAGFRRAGPGRAGPGRVSTQPAGARGGAQRPAWLPAAAARRARRRADGGRQRARGRPGRLGERGQGEARPVRSARRAGGRGRRHAVGR